MPKAMRVAIVGATGAIGEALLEILASRQFPVDKLFAVASKRSVGSTVLFRNRPVLVEELDTFDFEEVELVFFATSAAISTEWIPRATAAGCVVIDNSSAFRLDEAVPLVVPEVNPEALALYTTKKIVANPNCSTIQMMVALKPLYDAVGIEKIVVATYQSVSGAGESGISELATQSVELLNGRTHKPSVFPKTIAFNVIPHIDDFAENGYTKEEMKMVLETQKIFQDQTIRVLPTCVRVPVFYGHSEAVTITTKKKLSVSMARELLSRAPGIKLMDNPGKAAYPTPVTDAAGQDAVYVGRLREDLNNGLDFNLWVVSDAIRKGGALNAVQIAEILLQRYL